MEEAQQRQQPHIHGKINELNSSENTNVNGQSPSRRLKIYMWWFRMAIYTILVLACQSIGTILGRLYYDKGGKSKWMATLVQTAGFPILIPFLFLSPTQNKPPSSNDHQTKSPSPLKLASIYAFLGVFLAADCVMYSIGLLYLPVSTYSLICASQLGFNAVFSRFLNSQNFTPPIVNSLVLLTVSSTLLVFHADSSGSTKASKGKYIIGFCCTIGASAGYALMLSMTQFFFCRIIRRATFRVMLDLIIYQALVATGAILVGLFASEEWKGLKKEMDEFELGKVSYVMTLAWTAISWQVFSIGAVGLIFEVSSLFSNVISAVGLPIVPVLAVFIFHDRMDGVKVVAMVLAIWGFASYVYHHYIEDLKSKSRRGNAS